MILTLRLGGRYVAPSPALLLSPPGFSLQPTAWQLGLAFPSSRAALHRDPLSPGGSVSDVHASWAHRTPVWGGQL